MKAICVIPARMASSRYPGKPLKKLLGLEMINHIYRRCRACKSFDEVVVATCDEEIAQSIRSENGIAIMTADTHERCTDRVSEAVSKLPYKLNSDDLVLMVQGDEILVDPKKLAEMIDLFKATKPPVINLISRLYDSADFDDPNTVKVVTNLDGHALYMSRSCVPSQARSTGKAEVYQQTGIIAFQASFLEKFSSLKPTPYEIAESVDMMRVIEHGLTLRTVKSDVETIGVDTEADLLRAENIMRNDPVTQSYL